MMTNKVSALYIHIPFCEHICDYCDFPKLQYFRLFAEQYLKSLKREIENYQISELKTIYIGGGTPTALEDDLFEQLLKMVEPYSKGVIEYTIEANPESLSKEKLLLMKRYGINRISLGVESTNNEVLKSINRHHTFEDVQIAVQEARKNDFDNLNVDLIIGLPGVKKENFLLDLKKVVALNVEHISCYSLTVHPNTVFGIHRVSEPSDDLAREIYDMTHEYLEENGFIHYEVSNWAKVGRESKHNFTYWNNERYFGVGLGASGYVGEYRYTNTKNLKKYLRGEYIEEKSLINQKDDAFYEIMLKLRTNRGLDLVEYKNKFGEVLYESHKKDIDELVSSGYLLMSENRLLPTYEGMMILDQIIMKLTA